MSCFGDRMAQQGSQLVLFGGKTLGNEVIPILGDGTAAAFHSGLRMADDNARNPVADHQCCLTESNGSCTIYSNFLYCITPYIIAQPWTRQRDWPVKAP